MTTFIAIITYAIPLAIATRAVILACALIADAIIGEPDILWRRIPHPVVLFGRLIHRISRSWHSHKITANRRRNRGVMAIILLVLIAVLIGTGFAMSAKFISDFFITGLWPIITIEIVIVTMLLAGRSLDQHVRQVAHALTNDSLKTARQAVSMIVGRNPEELDEPAICRASIETTAENLSDGVVAPAFYYLIFGLPGILAYKMINTADSMIGYKSSRWFAFGWAAARLDDLVNLIPARLTGFIIVIAALMPNPKSAIRAMHIMWRDARLHRSPNAGWPEAAMAGALDIVLAGPRKYGARMSKDKPLNQTGRIAESGDIYAALGYLWRVTAIMITGLLSFGLLQMS